MKNIPVVINNFNRLTTTKRLANDLTKLGYTNIHILDNNSTYQPLLEWYRECPYAVKRLDSNQQWLAIYNSGYINEFLNKFSWIAYTDSDLELNSALPENFIDILIEKAEQYGYTKAGLALRCDDLPDNSYANHYRDWEQRYWKNKLEDNIYVADVDTTFCIIKPGLPFDYRAIRIAGNFTAVHRPWYTNFSDLDEEEKYYLEQSSEWSTYKRFYYAHVTREKQL